MPLERGIDTDQRDGAVSNVVVKGRRPSLVSVFRSVGARGTHVRNVGSYIVVRVFAILLYLIPVSLFIKHQGKASYGTLTLLLLVFSYTQVFDLGVGYAVNQRLGRAVARNSTRLTGIVQSAVPLFALFGIGMSAAIFLLSKNLSALFFGRVEHIDAIRAVAAAMGLLTLDALPVAVVQAYNRVDWINYSRLVIDGARAMGILIGAFAANGIAVAIAFTIGGVIAKTLVDIVLSGRLLGVRFAFKPLFRLRASAVNLRMGLPMVTSVFLSMLMMSVDRIYVSRAFGQGALAYYAVGADLCSKAYFLVWAITGSVYTLYVRRRANRRPADDLIRVSLIAVGLVALGFYLPVAVFAKEIIGIWINSAFAVGSLEITRIWAATAVAYLVMCVYYSHLRGFGKPMVLAGSGVIGLAIVAVCLWWLPGWLSVPGVALAVLFGFCAQAIFLWQCSLRARSHAAG